MCFDYDDYAEMVNASTVKCRKPHRCCGCRKMIAKGESAKLTTGKFDGSFFRTYECEACQRMIISIAAEEISHGCSWSEAWCATQDLRDYIADRSEPVALLEGTLDDCLKHVNDLWEAQIAERRAARSVQTV